MHPLFGYSQPGSWFRDQVNAHALDHQLARSGGKTRLKSMAGDAQIVKELDHVMEHRDLAPKKKRLRVPDRRAVHDGGQLRIQRPLDVIFDRTAYHIRRIERRAELADGVLEDAAIRLWISSFLGRDDVVDQMQYADGVGVGDLVYGAPVGDDGNAVSMLTQPDQSLDASWRCSLSRSVTCLERVIELVDLVKAGWGQAKRGKEYGSDLDAGFFVCNHLVQIRIIDLFSRNAVLDDQLVDSRPRDDSILLVYG